MDVLETLCRRYGFAEVRALLPIFELRREDEDRLQRLCKFGKRLMELDAEDFDMSDADPGGPEYAALVRRARACRMPQTPKESARGALRSLRPAYRLLLEVIAARHARDEMSALVAAVHIAEEYLPLLIWESVWEHAGDPLELGRWTDGEDSRFGVDGRECAHKRAEASAAGRALRIGGAPAEGWRVYLDRHHSTLARAVAVCAAACRDRCSVVNRLDPAQRQLLEERCDAALALSGSAVIKLRHAAPVGHGFGVPDHAEVAEAWDHTRHVLAARGGPGEAALAEDGYCLPGFASLISALAGVTLTPDTLLRDLSALTVDKLAEAEPRREGES